MNTEMKIQIPEGYEIDTNKSSLTDGNIVFKKKENTLPTTNEEAVKFLPETCYYINNNGDIDITEYSREDPNTIATQELAEAFLALIQLVKFRDIWNGDWAPDWSNSEDKYVIYFRENKKESNFFVSSHCPLAFKSEELRDKFSETFDELIQTAKPLL